MIKLDVLVVSSTEMQLIVSAREIWSLSISFKILLGKTISSIVQRTTFASVSMNTIYPLAVPQYNTFGWSFPMFPTHIFTTMSGT